jgi:pentatricopeptide repeat protein
MSLHIWLIGLIQAGRIEDALKIFHILEESDIDIMPACCVHLSKYLCLEGNLGVAVDVMLYTLKKGFTMQRYVGNRLLRSLCIRHRRKDAQALAWRMHDMDAYLHESTKGLSYNQ